MKEWYFIQATPTQSLETMIGSPISALIYRSSISLLMQLGADMLEEEICSQPSLQYFAENSDSDLMRYSHTGS